MRSALFVLACATDLSASLCPKPAPRFQHAPARAHRQAGHRHYFSCGGGVGLEHQPCHMRISSPLSQNKTKLHRFSTRKYEVNSPGLLLSLYPPRPPPAKLRAALREAARPGTSGCPAERREPGRRAVSHRPAEGVPPRFSHTAATGSVPGPGAGGGTVRVRDACPAERP